MHAAQPSPILTQDAFYKGKVTIFQPQKGYRFSIDAPILADFLPVLPDQEALEIGAGCGIISLLALYNKKFAAIHAIEIQESLTAIALRNARENNFSQKFHLVHGDFNLQYFRFAGITHAFSNPPFYKTNEGRLSPNPQIRIAKSEISLNLCQLLEKSYTLLAPKGNLYLILLPHRFEELCACANEIGFSIAKIREVFSFNDGNVERFLIQLTTYDVSTEKMKPLIIFKEKGIYTDEMDDILTG